VSKKKSDSILHPPSGSNVPGKEDPNPYVFYPPSTLRDLVDEEKNPEELDKIKSALKQWERIFVYPGYPYKLSTALRKIAYKMAGRDNPAINIHHYQETQVPEGYEGILDALKTKYDNYDMDRFDYNRQGERPHVDMDAARGDFLSPSDPVHNRGQGVVEPRGEGPNPDIFYPFPPTGGNLGKI